MRKTLGQGGVLVLPEATQRYFQIVGKNPVLAGLLVTHGPQEIISPFGKVVVSHSQRHARFVQIQIIDESGSSRDPDTANEYTFICDFVDKFRRRTSGSLS